MSRLNCNSVDTRSYINDRKFVRNIPSKSMANHYIGGPVPTRYINMPIIDCRKESNEKKQHMLDIINMLFLILDQEHHMRVMQIM